jgi:hypothetical protein
MSLPDYLYAEIFDHLDFHVLIKLRRADPAFSVIIDPLLKLRIVSKLVEKLRLRIKQKNKLIYFAQNIRLLQMISGMAILRYS